MTPKTKKTILLLLITSILTASMVMVYFDWQKYRPPPKVLIDDGVLLIYPRMTQIAYAPDSFYSFYKGECDSCITQKLNRQNYDRYNLGLNGFDLLNQSYYSINDIDFDKLDDISKQYHTLVVFHNEYVTQKVFDQITNHNNVIYLYPNALYGKVEIDYEKNTMTLVRGHNYPQKEISNGFDWKYDNSLQEKDCEIGKWNFVKIDNGIQLDCYPENIIQKDEELKNYIKDYIYSSKLKHIEELQKNPQKAEQKRYEISEPVQGKP